MPRITAQLIAALCALCFLIAALGCQCQSRTTFQTYSSTEYEGIKLESKPLCLNEKAEQSPDRFIWHCDNHSVEIRAGAAYVDGKPYGPVTSGDTISLDQDTVTIKKG